MKICFLTNNYVFTGGLERSLSLTANLLSKDHNIDVISLYKTNNACSYYYDSKIKIHVLFKKTKKDYIKDIIPSINKVHQILVANKYDYFIYVGEFLAPIAFQASKKLNIKTICWMHSPGSNFRESIIQRPIKWYSMKKAYFTITLTKDSVDFLKNRYKTSKISYIPNPLDPKLIKPFNYNVNSKKIITVGRICYAKNYEKLIEIANIVLHKTNDWTWDVYGDGNTKDKNKLLKLVSKYNLNNKLFFKGNVNNLYDIYHDYSFQVMTSRYEGFPMTLLEGMANGLPLLSFDIETGPKEIIKHKYNGFLIKAYDEAIMSKYILELINSSDKRISMSNNSQKYLNLYKPETILKQWNDLLHSI